MGPVELNFHNPMLLNMMMLYYNVLGTLGERYMLTCYLLT